MKAHALSHQANQAIDYTLAGVLTMTPVWVPVLANLNVIMTTLTLVIGLFLGILRLRRDFFKSNTKSRPFLDKMGKKKWPTKLD